MKKSIDAKSSLSRIIRSLMVGLLLLVPVTVSSTEFSIRYRDNAQQDFDNRGWMDESSLFKRNIRAAARLWAARIDSSAVVDLLIEADRTVPRAGGTNTTGLSLEKTAEGHSIWEPGALSLIRTGNNPGHSPADNYDIKVGINAGFLDEHYWLDPEPETRLQPAPTDRTDFIWIVMHEMGHGLGVNGFRLRAAESPDYGALRDNDYSLFDSLSRFAGTGQVLDAQGRPSPLLFTGDNSRALFGTEVPLTNLDKDEPGASQNFYHLGDCESQDVLRESLMNGCLSPNGRAHITAMDLAVYSDLGYDVIPLEANFSAAQNLLRLPFVRAPGMGVAEVEMELIDPEQLIFQLSATEFLPLGTDTPAVFSPDTGELFIPKVIVDFGDTITEFQIRMQLVDEPRMRFRLTSSVELP